MHLRQEDNVLSCRCRRDRAYNVLDVVDRIRYTGILCYALISEIDLAFSIKCYVLKKSVLSDCIVDIRLRFFIKVDNLSVASTSKLNTPLSSQPCSSSPIRRRLGSVESVVLPVPERPKKIAVFSPFKSVLAEQCMEAMPLSGRIVVHHGEHTFLHLSTVPCINDNLLTACNVEHYSCLRVKS